MTHDVIQSQVRRSPADWVTGGSWNSLTSMAFYSEGEGWHSQSHHSHLGAAANSHHGHGSELYNFNLRLFYDNYIIHETTLIDIY